MPYLIGTDEAGYGPNLGPLVVSATAWEVPEGMTDDGLQQALAPVVVSSPGGRKATDRTRVVLGDSKVLYQSGKGLHYLEYGLWAAMGTLGLHPTSWREVWESLAPGSPAHRQPEPWFADYDAPAPFDADPERLACQVAAFGQGLCEAGVRLVAMESRAVFPAQFNALLACRESKGALLSHVTLDLAASMIDRLPEASVSVVCDKHGGRNRYQSLLADHFPDWLIEVHGEGRERSVYRFGPAPRRIEFRFQVGGEEHVPAALASMASKYLRELAMRAWNDFWCARLPGLQPTAGYPVDARRFKSAIAELQQTLGIDDSLVWRQK
jgi:hypothetical protein